MSWRNRSNNKNTLKFNFAQGYFHLKFPPDNQPNVCEERKKMLEYILQKAQPVLASISELTSGHDSLTLKLLGGGGPNDSTFKFEC